MKHRRQHLHPPHPPEWARMAAIGTLALLAGLAVIAGLVLGAGGGIAFGRTRRASSTREVNQ